MVTEIYTLVLQRVRSVRRQKLLTTSPQIQSHVNSITALLSHNSSRTVTVSLLYQSHNNPRKGGGTGVKAGVKLNSSRPAGHE